MGQRRPSVRNAGPRPPSARIAGWMPRANSRSSSSTPVSPVAMPSSCALSSAALGGAPTAERNPPLPGGDGARAGGLRVVIDPGRPARLEHQRGHVPPADAPPGGQGGRPGRQHGDRAVGIVPVHGHQLGLQEPPDLLGDRGENLLRPRSPGYQRRHPPPKPSWLSAVDRKSTRLNSSHVAISYAVFCLKKKKK